MIEADEDLLERAFENLVRNARDAAGPLAAGAPPVDREYVVHQGLADRPGSGDLGAFEFCATGCAPVGGADAGAVPATDAGTIPGPVDAGTPGAGEGPDGLSAGCAVPAGGRPDPPFGLAILAALAALRASYPHVQRFPRRRPHAAPRR